MASVFGKKWLKMAGREGYWSSGCAGWPGSGALGPVSGTRICQWYLVCFVSQLMRNLLGTHLGHSAIYNMCRIMEDR